MAVLFDTTPLAGADRLEAFRSALLDASGSTRVELETPDTGVWGQMSLWSFGSSRIFTSASSGQWMMRDAKAARGASPEAVAVAVHGVGQGRHVTRSGQRLVRSGDLMVVDVTRPFDFAWSGPGSSTSIQIPAAELGLPVEVVQRAADNLHRSPLYGLVSRHLVDMTRDASRLSASPTAAALGTSTAQLVRALLAGAVEDLQGQEVLDETLLAQVHAHVRQHLREPDLGPDSIAAALAVSRRQLFRVCTSAGVSLEQLIIERRLEAARVELAQVSGRSRTIASVALWWGFKDPTHFSRRFRAAYGMLPREWRALAASRSEQGLAQDPVHEG